MITILLSTFNGTRFLPEQLASFAAQTDQDWRLLWRNDGSSDSTHEITSRLVAGIFHANHTGDITWDGYAT